MRGKNKEIVYRGTEYRKMKVYPAAAFDLTFTGRYYWRCHVLRTDVELRMRIWFGMTNVILRLW